ncbi:VOC family protein [Robertkochia sediminum]|uniref:VOC family protein n=1 Tax=Robertkochia sediminum TaxID=2785326 RepID=UPI0019315E9D|nr:VOC family protein [Robertkochia sediminum]MBL7472925.1 VOC family protein [Robertkochia sediminum]
MNLNQITVPSLDLDISVPFYENLGLKLIVKAVPHYARFVCPDGNASFSIHRVDELPSGEGVYVYFECDDLDEKVAELKTLGIQFDQDPTDQPWLWREARLKDPDGNRLILYYGGENRLDPPWRIKEETR